MKSWIRKNLALTVACLSMFTALFGQPIKTMATTLMVNATGRSATAPALTVQDLVAGGDLLWLRQGTTSTPPALRVLSNGVILLQNGASVATGTPSPTITPSPTP